MEILLSLKNHLLNITTGFFPHLHIQSPELSISYTLLFTKSTNSDFQCLFSKVIRSGKINKYVFTFPPDFVQ